GDFRSSGGGGAGRSVGERTRREACRDAAGERSLPLRADAAGSGPAGGGVARAEFCGCAVSGGGECGCDGADGAEALRDALIRQVTGPVRWVESMRQVTAEGPARFVEVGPGKVLCGLMRQIDRSQTCTHVDDVLRDESTASPRES